MKVKKLTAVVSCLMMLLVFVLTLSPVTIAQTEEKGSITLNLTSTDKPLENVSFRLYLIAKAYKNADGIRYELIAPYDNANIDISNLQDSALPLHLAYFAESHSLGYTELSTDEKGILVFEDLSQGLYLVVPSQNGEYTISPFVISVPDYDSKTKEWQYNIDATPKIPDIDFPGDGSETYISVVKKWEGNKLHPDSVIVVLLCDFQEYAQVQLSEYNNWHYRWDNLPKNHVWNVLEADVPDGYTVSYDSSSNTVTIINKSEGTHEEGTTKPSEGGTEEDKLVQTGQLNWPVPVCAIAGLLIFSMGWAVLNFGRKESE